jgi:hypothetical protein
MAQLAFAAPAILVIAREVGSTMPLGALGLPAALSEGRRCSPA